MSRLRAKPNLRQRLQELEEKPGTDPEWLQQQVTASIRRMEIIDEQPAAWRALLNDYPHSVVAEAAEVYGSPQATRRALERQLGKPI